jgi:hypothetical protein
MSDEFDGLDAMEKTGIGATSNRCRALASKIGNELRNKRPEHFVEKLPLADIHWGNQQRGEADRACSQRRRAREVEIGPALMRNLRGFVPVGEPATVKNRHLLHLRKAAGLNYSITSSARASSVGGTSRPSAFGSPDA